MVNENENQKKDNDKTGHMRKCGMSINFQGFILNIMVIFILFAVSLRYDFISYMDQIRSELSSIYDIKTNQINEIPPDVSQM